MRRGVAMARAITIWARTMRPAHSNPRSLVLILSLLIPLSCGRGSERDAADGPAPFPAGGWTGEGDPAGTPTATATATPTAEPTPAGPMPDLMVDAPLLASSKRFTTEEFPADDCAVVEGCIAGPGPRDLLRFSTGVVNMGTADLHIGDPSTNPEDFDFSACHGHYHYKGFAEYELTDASGVVVTGHKQAFCLMDGHDWGTPNAGNDYDCSNQGLSVGWEDIYSHNLDCQWVDVTGLPSGDYTLTVKVNAEQRLDEWGPGENDASIPVQLP